MITINLSDEQAKTLLECLGWRTLGDTIDLMAIEKQVAREMFIQLENEISPRSTEAASLAAWRHEAGYTEKTIEDWKRKHETMEIEE
jgi:hypothetical protein|nr:MAG TPA: hypothetical protein [Caudoviricetes sp.]